MGDLSRMRGTVLGLFPWIAHVSLSETTKALAIRSANKLIELAGGGPAVARVGDGAGYLYAVVTTGVTALYWSAKSGAGSSWTLVASGASPPVDGVTTGTGITITTGSERVTCG